MNSNYFNEWNDRMSYVLGYIWSDGWIEDCRKCGGSTLGFKCSIRDRKLIENIRTDMDSHHKLTEVPERVNPKNGSLSGPQIRLAITDSFLVSTLKNEHGLRRGKSKLDLPFPIIPDEYLRHFSRGYLDGDGSVGDKGG